MDGGSCVDAHSKGFREALQLLFLANTEAVVLPEYSSALSAGIDGLQDVASCGARCALGAVVPGGGNVRVELAKRLLDNDLTPPVVLSLVLRHLGSAIVKVFPAPATGLLTAHCLLGGGPGAVDVAEGVAPHRAAGQDLSAALSRL